MAIAKKSDIKEYIVLGLVAFTLLSLLGCFGPNMGEIKKYEDIIDSSMNDAGKLLEFKEADALVSFQSDYQSISDAIGTACDKLATLDKNKQYVSKTSKSVCESKKGIDDCFFQIEKINAKIKSKNTDVNLDNLEVLCRDLRSIEYDDELETFVSQEKSYVGWLKAESSISVEWDLLVTELWNMTSEQLGSAKMSDYYKEQKDSMNRVKVSLQNIKDKCSAKNLFKATDSKTEKICNNIDDYFKDLNKMNEISLDTFEYLGLFESGTLTIDDSVVDDCYSVDKAFIGTYDFEINKDTKPDWGNVTNLTWFCDSIDELNTVYSKLGISLIFENGELSSSTKTEMMKAKTVYIETDTALGSGVIIDSDESGYYVLTNAHVVLSYDDYTGQFYKPSYIKVKFYDGRLSRVNNIAYTPEYYDLVLLYVPSSGYYPIASFYDSYYPSIGDKVVAVGNPYGLEFTVTQGIVSAVRDIGCMTDYCYGEALQTDTAINPGNSGGGLWDYKDGTLLGINSLGLTEAQGLNFAISMVQYALLRDTFKPATLD
jgi:S1-C subfamily serine protease